MAFCRAEDDETGRCPVRRSTLVFCYKGLSRVYYRSLHKQLLPSATKHRFLKKRALSRFLSPSVVYKTSRKTHFFKNIFKKMIARGEMK